MRVLVLFVHFLTQKSSHYSVLSFVILVYLCFHLCNIIKQHFKVRFASCPCKGYIQGKSFPPSTSGVKGDTGSPGIDSGEEGTGNLGAKGEPGDPGEAPSGEAGPPGTKGLRGRNGELI